MARAIAAALALALGGVVVSSGAQAQLAFTKISDTTDFHGGTARDDVTGVYYRLPGYGTGYESGVGGAVRYNSVTDFEAGINGIAIAFTRYGTNFAAHGGFVYGNASAASSTMGTLGKWDLTTGNLVASASYAGFGGRNGPDSFDWGGFSAMNVFNDNGTMYLLSGSGSGNSSGGGASGGNASVARLNADMTLSNVRGIDVSQAANFFNNNGLGWAFVAGGKLFASEEYDSDTSLSYTIDLATGSRSTSAIAVTGLTGRYVTNANYVQATDTLYVWDAKALFKATGAGAVLGLQASAPVPEPASWTMLLVGFAGLGVALRRDRRKSVRFA